MHMAMHHVAGMILFDEGVKYREPAVRQIFLVADAADRSMGQQDIKAMASHQGASFALRTREDICRSVYW